MQVLLLGERGYLGSYLLQNLNVDTLKSRDIYDNGIQYDYVINCIGKPDLEYCELHKNETDYSNRDIILDIQKYYPTAKIINFSSYYVYDNLGLCFEDSNVTYDYNYTRQNLEGERLVSNGITFRLGKLFGHLDLVKQQKLTEYIISNNSLNLDCVQFNPTSLAQVLKAIQFELNTNSLNGIYNLSNSRFTTHYAYGQFINDYLSAFKTINVIDKIPRNFTNYGKFTMSCDKLSKFITLSTWQDDLADYLTILKNNNENSNSSTFTSS